MSEILAIDFGTTHTHCSSGQTDSPNVDSASIETDRNGTLTALLFKNGKCFLYGHTALEEYVNVTVQAQESRAERAGLERIHVDNLDGKDVYDLAVNFKPDIEHSPDAREKAKYFLEKIADTLHIDAKNTQVVIGVPAGSGDEYRKNLKNLMKDRFGEVETISEPTGALCHFLAKKTLDYSDVLNDVLVVDFGGGTCDFAYCCNGKMVDVDLEEGFFYGGRLFDDLFFQWWEAKNPERAAECPEDIKNALFMIDAREAKERFSTRMSQDEKGPFTYLFRTNGAWGGFEDITWEEFLERAGNYRPSRRFLNTYRRSDKFFAAAEGNSMDLRQRFRDLLQAVRRHYQERQGKEPQFSQVVLAGGSSLWLFVKADVMEILGVPESAIRRAPDPYATISKGLALIPWLRGELEKKKSRLKGETLENCRKCVRDTFQEFIQRTGNYVKNDLWPTDFDALFRGYFKADINRTGLDMKVERQILVSHEKLKEYLRAQLEEMSRSLWAELERIIREAAEKNQLTLPRTLGMDRDLKMGDILKLFHGNMENLMPSRFMFAKFFLYKTSDLLSRIAPRFAFIDVDKKVAEYREKFASQVKENFSTFFEKEGFVPGTMRQVESVLKDIIEDIGILQSQIR